MHFFGWGFWGIRNLGYGIQGYSDTDISVTVVCVCVCVHGIHVQYKIRARGGEYVDIHMCICVYGHIGYPSSFVICV